LIISIYYPGTEEFEIDRLHDYIEDTEATCSSPLDLTIPSSATITLCMDSTDETSTKPCQLVLIR